MKNFKEDIRQFLDSKITHRIITVLGIFMIALFIFSLGVTVGFHKANFGRAWGEHYSQNFGPARGGARIGIDKVKMIDWAPNAHGTIGKILKVEAGQFIVEDKDGTEKIVLLTEQTKIQKNTTTIMSTELRADDFVVVIGSPNSAGQIEAKLIRVIPSPELLTQ